jgi:transposase
MVARDRARTKNRIKSFLRGRGVSTRTGAIFATGGCAKAARGLPAATGQALAFLERELEFLTGLKAEAEEVMLRASLQHAVARRLETAPGMGPIRVAQLLPIVVTPHRFRTKRQFWAYCGFGVVTRTSADWAFQDGCWVRAKVTRTRGLNSYHNRRLKAIFKGAATTVIAHAGPSPLREHYEKLLAEGTNPNLAKLTVARRIAAIVLAMWKQGERYDAKKVPVRAAV